MLNKKALAGTPSTPPAFVEDVFSTYLYTGTGATLAINNGIDLSGKGGLVWTKGRDGAFTHSLVDSNRGISKWLGSNLAAAQDTFTDAITSFNNNGFTLGADTQGGYVNASTYKFCSWTFAEQAKFFDVVTYTGNGAARTIAHNLGSVPGMMLVKATSGTADWNVYHRSLGNTFRLLLNSTAQAFDIGSVCWNATTPTSSVFSLGTNTGVNADGVTYVAYLFAHDAGGFGTAGTDNVISCGSFTIDGSGFCPVVNLGYEPQYLLVKCSSNGSNWIIVDTMRGFSQTDMLYLAAQSSGAETNYGNAIVPTATGFGPGSLAGFLAGSTFIYMAIRRPMKVPTTGTSVFSPNAVNVSSGTKVTTGFPVDWQINFVRTEANYNGINFSRLLGVSSNDTNSGQVLWTTKTDAEASYNGSLGWDNTGFKQSVNLFPDQNNIYWNFKRAPGFFDQVCYTGTGSARTVTHNLTVVPELIIVKSRSTAELWAVYSSSTGNANFLRLNTTAAVQSSATMWDSTTPTSSVFSTANNTINASGVTHVAYLFATLAGVSKVGSYTGNGSSQTINCGFTAGARFVLIKRTDASGDWYVYDTARGIVSGNDPQLKLNSTAAEATGYDAIDPDNSGFIVNNDGTNFPINVNNATYIFLAIA